jgi:nucleoside-diphosphate-sugar epimerase
VTNYLPAEVTPQLILHFASPASPPRYQAFPVETYLVNSLATHHLAQYIKHQAPTCRMVFASTSEVYGDPAEHPQSETYWGNVNPNGVRSCYDEAKRLGETICGVHHRDFGLDIRIVRIFNTYGPRMDPADGRIIPQFVTEALRQQPLSVYGDGQQTRSYCYVDDLVRGIIEFANREELAGVTVNLGNPEEYTVLETAEIIFELIRGHAPTEQEMSFRPLPKDDPVRRQPDISKAQQLLDWHPQTSFRQGLQPTIEHFRSVL